MKQEIIETENEPTTVNPAMTGGSKEVTHGVVTNYVDMEGKKILVTTQDQVKDVINTSGVAFELDINDLFSLSERGKAIASVNDENFVAVKKEMQKQRKYVTEYFEAARKGFNEKAKGVIDIQKLVLAEFTPQEDRLVAMDKAEKERVVKEARLEALPRRQERIAAIGGEVILPEEWMGTFDDYLLEMEDADFEIYVVQRQGEKNEADRLALAAERQAMEAKAKAAQDALDAQKAQADAIEDARKQERELAAENLRIAEQRLVDERKEAADRKVREEAEVEDRRVREAAKKVQQEKDDAAQKVQSEADAKAAHEASLAAKAADTKYQSWLLAQGVTAENINQLKFITLPNGSIEVYMLIGTYAKD